MADCAPKRDEAGGALLERVWDERHAQGSVPFTLLSWNVFQDGSAQFDDGRRGVAWEQRSPLHLAEIARAAADVVCLCELNRFEDFWAPQMWGLGYSVAARVTSIKLPGSYKATGAAVFVRGERFRKLRDFSFVAAAEEGRGGDRRPAACAVLHDVAAGRELCVVMAHLMPPGKGSDAQRAREMTEVLEKLEREVSGSPRTGVVICGDWNNPPGSPMELCLVGEEGQRKGLARCVDMRSAYAHHPPYYTAQDFASGWNRGDPQRGKADAFAAVPGAWMDVFDFIYHSPPLAVQRSWREPAFDDTVRGQDPPRGIPGTAYPSDHVALAATLAWVD